MTDDNSINQLEQNTENKKSPILKRILMFSFIALLLIVVTVLCILASKKKDEVSKPSPVGSVPQKTPSILVSKAVDENQMKVEGVDMVSYGFIAVFNDNSGNPGNVIGVSDFLKTGTYNDIYIPLTENVEDGDTLHILIVADDGNQTFDYPMGDQLVVDDMNSPIGATITVSLQEESVNVDMENEDEEEEVATESAEEEELTPTVNITPTEVVSE